MATTSVVTSVPSHVSEASLIKALHDHANIIDALAPGNTAQTLISGDPLYIGTPCVYNITAPTPVGTSTYPLTITNLADGVDTLAQPKPPVGKLEIKAKWRVAKGHLREDVVIDGNFMTKRMAKGNVEKNHPGKHGELMQKAACA
ncbi:hypothetical protein Q7P37_002049 [Cladosporium fusiforme]